MLIIDKFQKIEVDLSYIGLLRVEFEEYFCTPIDSVIFASLGIDGIHFCIIPSKEDKTLENSPVYVVSPFVSEHYVEPVAENFIDFLSLVAITKDAAAIECISYVSKETFNDYLNDVSGDSKEASEAIRAIKETFILKDISDVYQYVKGVQQNIEFRKVKFSQEYYNLIGESEL